jgi:hypothetical protein
MMVSSIFMLVLTVVMFGISTVYFTLDIILVSNGILHPREHPETVIGLWGQWITAQIVYQVINVMSAWSPT